MATQGWSPTAAPGPTLHARIVPVGAGLLIAAFVTDVFYVRTVSDQWETFSVWLITGGLIIAALAGLALLVDLAISHIRISRAKLALFTAVVVLSMVNAFVHSRDGYTAVAPSGIVLSGVVALLLVFAGVGGWSLAHAPAAHDVSR